MDRFRSWIDLQRLQLLVEETAWSPSQPDESLLPPPRRGASRFTAPEATPPSPRRTPPPHDAPQRSFAPPRPDERRTRGWTEYLDDDPRFDEPPRRAKDLPYHPERTEPRVRPRMRVEPPPEPRPSFEVAPVEHERADERPRRADSPAIRLERASRPGAVPTEPRIERRRPILNRDVEPPPEPVVPPKPSLPPPPAFTPRVGYQPPRGAPLPEKLAHLLDWAADVSGLEVAFVADHEGLLLARRQATDVEEAVAVVLEGFLEQLAPFLGDELEGHVTLRSHGRVFVVTWHETQAGRFFLGIVGANTPPPSVVPELASALAATVVEVSGMEPPAMGRPAPLAESAEPPPPPAPTVPPPAPTVPPPVAEPAPPPMPAPPSPAEPTVTAPLVPTDSSSTPPPEVPPPSTRRLLLQALRERAAEPHTALLRVSLQTGLSLSKLQTPDGLTEAEYAAVEQSVERIVGTSSSAGPSGGRQ